MDKELASKSLVVTILDVMYAEAGAKLRLFDDMISQWCLAIVHVGMTTTVRSVCWLCSKLLQF